MIFPLRFKLALLSSLLLVVAIGTVSLVVLDQSARALADEAGKRAVVLAQQLARNAREPLLLEDDLMLAQLLGTLSKESEVSVVRVLDKDGRVVASSPQDAAPQAQLARMTADGPLETVAQNGMLVVAARMTYRDVDIGEAQVVLDVASVTRGVVQRARRNVLIASGVLLVVGLVIAFVVSGMVSRPLQRLRLAVNALAAGDLSARVEPTSRDEVGVLTRAFNEMSESLGEKRRIETAFRRYVSDHVLREVVESPEAIHLKGELREVSVLYLDIRKFTRLTGSIGPERVVAFLNECFDLITGRLLEHGATVDKYIGDAILAYLGAPIETEDHAQRAVAAAIAVQRAIHERNQRSEASLQPFVRLEVGIGIHTGMVVVGNIGSELKMDYTAIGEPVNVANRLQALAGPGQIKITGEVRARVAELVQVKPEGARMLEGVDHPIEVFEVVY
ncbi:MAG TPA: adenylate/guanylate cyclase domain-containing protein [Myxococcota bacterium]|nr:adenylate/guanylate cyclase domain-containing protein [Myxococcota bacterium]